MSGTVLILGAGGFIGRHLAEHFAQAGDEVVAATRSPSTFGHPAIRNVVAPFASKDDFLPALEGCRAIVHAASITTPGSSMARPQLDGNLRTTLALLEALQTAPAPTLLFLSSGGTLYGDSDHPVDEQAPLRPRSYHAAGKIAAEYFIRAWATQFDGRAAILRPSNVYGPGQAPRAGFGIIPTAFAASRSGQPLTILGDGSSVRDYLYIDDLVALCAAVVARPPDATLTCNAGSGQGVRLDELLAEIERATGSPLARAYQPARRVDVDRIVLDNTLAQNAFDWTPATPLAEGLQRAWRWFREQ